jgi:hypothetical protein
VPAAESNSTRTATVGHDQHDDYSDPHPPARPWSNEKTFWVVVLALAALFYGFVWAVIGFRGSPHGNW